MTDEAETQILHDGETPEVIGGGGAIDAAPDTIWEAIAEARQEIADSKTVFIRVPGYHEKGILLYIKYRLLSPDELKRITKGVERVKDRWERNLAAAMDTLVVACEGMFLDPSGDEKEDEFKALTIGGEPVQGFTAALASKLGMVVQQDAPARSVVSALFGGNMIAIAQHSGRLQRWMGNTESDVNAELTGEI